MAASSPQHDSGMSHDVKVYLGVTCALTGLSTIAVFLRFLSRTLSRQVAWDDWFSLAALVFAYGFMVVGILVCTVGQVGYPSETYSPEQLSTYLKLSLPSECLYNAVLVTSKASILLLYRRIFPQQWFRRATEVVGFLLLAFCVSNDCGLIFTSSPVQGQWEPWIPHSSLDSPKLWLAMGIVNILLDVVVMALPQPVVWKLQQSTHRKAMISLLFATGIFVTATSIVRAVLLETIDLTEITETFTNAGTWTAVEANLSIVVACLPTFPYLIHRWQGKEAERRPQFVQPSHNSRARWNRLQRLQRLQRGTHGTRLGTEDDHIPIKRGLSFSGGSHEATCARTDSVGRETLPNRVNVRTEYELFRSGQ